MMNGMHFERLNPSQMTDKQLVNWARCESGIFFATAEQLEQERKAGRVGEVYPVGKEFIVRLP